MGKGIVIAFGAFDILHPGHIHYLKEAGRYGRLVVVVARDESIAKLKGKRPLMDERSRLAIISSLRVVDKAILGSRIGRLDDMYNVMLKVKPSVVALGYDQKVDMKYLKDFLTAHRMGPRIVRISSYRKELFKSSKIKDAAGLTGR